MMKSREGHGKVLMSDGYLHVIWNKGGQIIPVAQAHEFAVLLDVTDVEKGMSFLAEIDLAGIGLADYGGVWWLSLQAPYLYVAGLGQGLFVVDVSNPISPVLVNQLPTGSVGGKKPRQCFRSRESSRSCRGREQEIYKDGHQ